ncbi:MAG TPA: AarF/UbiB family protein [Gemmatimonadaceae bacterium]|nr:AarF/UbiB family protein [Gemmatimonadaceae bacterium]
MRAIVVSLRLLPFALSFLRDQRRWIFFGRPLPRSAAFHLRRADELVATIADLGPTFVKLAQVLGARADLVPEPYITALGRLHDRVPPVPYDDVARTIQEAYGVLPETLFDDFQREPIAAASLGQVHRARFEGQDIAVKVLRPGVEELVAIDVRAAERIIRAVGRFWRNRHIVALDGAITEFAARVGDEMDFRKEAVIADEIRAHFAGSRDVVVPRVFHTLTRQRVLVLEYLDGRRIDALGEWVAEGRVSGRAIVRIVMEMYIRMMLVDGLFHADPHPGNLLVTKEGKLVLLDFGMAVRVPRELRLRLVETVFAAIRGDVSGIVRGFQSLGIILPDADREAIEALVEKLLAIANERTETREKLERLLADQVLHELYDAPIVLPSDLVYFARTASLIEGLGTRYDPHFNPIDFAGPIALRLRGRIMASLRDPNAPRPTWGRDGDWFVEIGGLLGDVAGVVQRAGRELVTIFGERMLGAR